MQIANASRNGSLEAVFVNKKSLYSFKKERVTNKH